MSEGPEDKLTIDPLLTPSEVCSYLKIHRSTLDRWVKEGRVPPPICPGGEEGERTVRRWRRSDLDAHLEKCRLTVA